MSKRAKINNLSSSMKYLPNELISHTFAHLHLKDIKKISTNKECREFIGRSFEFWKEKFKGVSGCRVSEIKDEVKKKYNTYKNWYKGKERRITTNCEQTDITQLKIYKHFIITSSDDRTIKIFDMEKKSAITLTGHTAGVWCFDIYNKYLISGSIDKTVRIWNIESGALERILTGHLSTVRSIKVYKDYIASGSRDSTIKIWKSGELLYTLKKHKESVRTLDMDDIHLVSGSYDGNVILWNYRNGRIIKILKKHNARVYAVLLGRKYIISSSLDGNINVSDKCGEYLFNLKGHRRIVSHLKFDYKIFNDEERYLLSAGEDGVLNKWDLLRNKNIFSIKESTYISSIGVCNGLIFIGLSNQVRVYKINDGRYVRTVLKNITLMSGIECLGDKLVIAYKKDLNTKLDVISYL